MVKLFGLFVISDSDSRYIISKPRKLIINVDEYLLRNEANIKDLKQNYDVYRFKLTEREREENCVIRPIIPSAIEVEVLAYDSVFEL